MAEWLTWDQQRLEDEYSPTKWSKRCPNGKPAQWILDNHIQLVTQESNEVRKAIPCKLDGEYGVRQGEKFDIYGAESLPKDAPVFVYIHGGYWQLLGKSISAYCVKPLHNEGITSIIVGYDLAPNVEFHEIIEEIQTAISAILNWAAERGSRGVAIGGHSAGAHLATMLMYRENNWAEKEPNLNLIKALVHISGVFDLRPIAMTSINDPLKLTSATAEKFSPLHNLEKLKRNVEYLKHIQQLIVVAENDPNEFRRQSSEYAQALRDVGFQVEHKVLDSLDHFDIVEKLREDDYSLTKDIVKILTSAK